MLHKKTFAKKRAEWEGEAAFLTYFMITSKIGSSSSEQTTPAPRFLSTTNGAQQSSLHWTAIVLYFHQRFTSVLRLIEHDMFAYVLKISAIGHSQCDVQIDIDANDSWVRTNHMELAIDERPTQRIGGPERKSRSLQNF